MKPAEFALKHPHEAESGGAQLQLDWDAERTKAASGGLLYQSARLGYGICASRMLALRAL
jgi:hypothetical protein